MALSITEIIVTNKVGAVIADVSEVSAQRTIIIERQGQSADGTRSGLHYNRHIHRDAELFIDWPLHRKALRNVFSSLIHKQIDRVTGMMPK